MKDVSHYLTVAASLAVFLVDGLATAVGESRANVVLILADDLGFSDLGCYGGEIDTPNLDRLAAEGMRFTQFYNCGVCRTTRATLLTGVHPRRRNRARLLHPDMVTIAEVLKETGYQTSLTGKWHFPQRDIGFPVYRPTERGFGEYFGIANGCCNYFDPAKAFPDYDKGVPPVPFLHNEEEVTEFSGNFYATDAFTDHAIQQIGKFSPQAKSGDAPFFVHLRYTAPHYPLHAKPRDIAKYSGRYDDGYFALRERRHRRLIELGLIDANAKLSTDDPQLGEFRYDYAMTSWENVEDRERETQRMEVYAAMVDSMDQGIGRVTTALEENGVAENTLVMFLSVLTGEASDETAPSTLCWGLYGNRAVRQGKWKMVWGTTARKWELYNLKVDRTETTDVIDKHPNQVRRMEQAWLRWAKQTGYPLTGNAL